MPPSSIPVTLTLTSVSYTHLDVYKRQPELLAENVNSWFQREPTQRMVRTLDGTVRAFLSNRYRRIDNLDIAEIVLQMCIRDRHQLR